MRDGLILRIGVVRSWDTDYKQRILRCSDCFSKRLGKSEMRFKVSAWQIFAIVKLTSIGHPLVNQDQTRQVLIEEQAQSVSRVCRPLIVLLDHGVALLTAELPCERTP